MNEILQVFLAWAKDPFHKKEVLAKHTDVINNIYATQLLTKEATKKYRRQEKIRKIKHQHHIMAGANPYDRAFLGNRHIKD